MPGNFKMKCFSDIRDGISITNVWPPTKQKMKKGGNFLYSKSRNESF